MLRLLVAAALVAACSAFAPATPALQLSKVAARADGFEMMARAPPKKAAKAATKAAPKKAAPKKVVAKKVVATKKVAPKPAPKAAPKKTVAKKAPAKKSFQVPRGQGRHLPA